MLRLSVIALASMLIAVPVAADDCDYVDSRQAVIAVDAAARLRVDASAGFLRIVGEPGLDEVIAEGTACAGRESDLDKIELVADRRGSSVLIKVEIPDFDWSWNRYARLDLTLRVPSDLALDIEDGSGSITIEGVGATRIDDGSGEIDVERVNGDLTIEDGSGEIDVRDVNGSVHVREDGSGSLRVEGVRGDVTIDEDGSGSISLRDVGGSVRIREDGSGSIRAVEVTGDFVVDRDGSGGITVDRIGGRIEIPD